MRFIKAWTFVATATSVFALAACNPAKDANPAEQVAKGPVAATVNGVAISQRTVDMVAKQGAGAGRPDTPESRTAIIDQFALQMLVAEEAIKKGLDKSPEVAEQIDAMKQSVLARAYVQDFSKNSPVTDDMVKAEYERIKATITGSEYKARHILWRKKAKPRTSSPGSGRNRGLSRNWQ